MFLAFPRKTFLRQAGLALACGIICGIAPLRAEVALLNQKSGDIIDWPLAMLYGKTSVLTATQVSLGGLVFPVKQGFFKAYALLKPGQNLLQLDLGAGENLSLTLTYQPKTNARYMKLIWFLGSDQGETFEAPEGMANGPDEIRARLGFAGLLMQTFYAETGKRTADAIKSATLAPKRTFRLEADAEGMPTVHIVKSTSRTSAEWRAMGSSEAYSLVHQEIRKILGTGNFKQAVLMGWSNQEHLEKGVAWGGGTRDGEGNGATTGCNLYAWAADLSGLVSAMSNTKAPETGLCRDWNLRTYGAQYALTLGGFLHEMGHAFGRPHSDYGIMASDFQWSNRFFTVEDALRNKEFTPWENELLPSTANTTKTWWVEADLTLWEGTYFTSSVVTIATTPKRRANGHQGLGPLRQFRQGEVSLWGTNLVGQSFP